MSDPTRGGLPPLTGNLTSDLPPLSGDLSSDLAVHPYPFVQSPPTAVPDPESSYWMRLATHILNAAQGIPGVKAVEAAGGMIGSHFPGNTPMSYSQSLQTLNDMTGNIGGKTSAVEHLLGGTATLPFLAASPILAGAEYGAADQALGAEPESLPSRAERTAIGGLLGAGTGAALHGLTGLGSMVLDRAFPQRVVNRSLRGLLSADDIANLAKGNELAPGGASLASSVVPDEGLGTSRLLPLVRGVGQNTGAARGAESAVGGQLGTLQQAAKRIGAQMDAQQPTLPLSPQMQKGLDAAKELLGPKHGTVLSNETNDAVATADVRDVLSRLRYTMRNLENRGPDAQGVTKHDYAQAIKQITGAMYDAVPAFRNLDNQYATVMDQTRAANDVLEAVQRSRANYAGTSAYGKDAESLGASIHGHGPSFYTHLHNILANPKGVAGAVARSVVAPTTPAQVVGLLRSPLTTPADLARYGLLGAYPPINHLLSPSGP